jgi:transaldolase/glucose-6-phosphate isomerase
MSSPIQQLYTLGQSLWYDNIQRRLLESGELANLIGRGDIRGVTSNPSIFHNAIANTDDYDSALLPLAWSGWKAEQIFWQLAIEDIRRACDLFLPLYQASEGADGYVSLEVSPTLAHQTDATLAQVRQLWEWVKRPNLMVKIPATPEGIPAVRAAIAAGINVNITLIFSLERYRLVMDAYLAGLDERLQAGLPVGQIASVASFFVSRMDTKVDKQLEALGSAEARGLLGKTAIAYAKLAYDEFRQVFDGNRFVRYQSAGCRIQRPLWASTSTKNPAYPDTVYVENLIGPATVDTVPPQTLEAFRQHGKAAPTLTADLDEAHRTIAAVEGLGISMQTVTGELEQEGVKSFGDAFTALLETIEQRRQQAVDHLGPLAVEAARRISHLEAEAVPARLWAADPTLWTSDPQGQEEVRIRTGWLRLPFEADTRKAAAEAEKLAAEMRRDGFTHILLLGMGGSSLAPEVLSMAFASQNQRMTFAILDSTDPFQVLELDREFPPAKTLYIVASKSGGTAEVTAMLDYFWERCAGDGSHFIAITDPGTSLDALANARGFRKVFLADPHVGGRYSALSAFGVVPAVMLGIDARRLLDRALWMAGQCRAEVPSARNPGLVLGAILGQAALSRHDKLTLLADEEVASFGAWLEQLIAESTGKQGKGILPVDGEPVRNPESYQPDRLFIYLRRQGKFDTQVKELLKAGHPVLVFDLPDPYSLGAEFYRWELATAVACAVLRVNAFDQPDVQDSKNRTKDKIDAYRKSGKLEEAQPFWKKAGIKLYSPNPVPGKSLAEVIKAFLGSAREHDYVAINAYVPRNSETSQKLLALRQAIGAQTGCATTLGFGPRFQHSTGQLHKGGPDNGLFLQITVEPAEDIEIPSEGMTFGLLEHAQALGDFEALAARNRRILRLHFSSQEGIGQVISALK